MSGKNLISVFGLLLAFLIIFGASTGAAIDLKEEEWCNPQDLWEFVDFFKELKYEFISAAGETDVSYLLEGEEELNGESVNRLLLEAVSFEEDFKFTVWIDKEGDVKRVRDENSQEDIPTFLANVMLQGILTPFFTVEEFEMAKAITGEYEGYTVEHIDTAKEQIGKIEAEVYYFSVEHEDDEVLEGSATYRVADFGEFQMMIGFDIPNYEIEELEFIEFNITSMALN